MPPREYWRYSYPELDGVPPELVLEENAAFPTSDGKMLMIWVNKYRKRFGIFATEIVDVDTMGEKSPVWLYADVKRRADQVSS